MMTRLPMDARRRTRRRATQDGEGVDPLARLAHALRTPLNAILGFSELMADARFGAHANPRYAEYSSLIHRSAGEMLTMIDALTRLLRLRDGTWPVERSAIDPVALGREAAARAAPRASARGQRIVLGVPARAAPVMLDGALAGEALDALLANAIDFSPDGAAIDLRVVAPRGGGLRLEVRDRGIGIAATDLARVCEPFVQLKPAGLPSPAGHGLGLALVAAIAARDGATLHLARRRGGGLVVSLSWPARS